MDQICPKRYFQSKTQNVNIINEFCIFKLVLVPDFSLNWQYWFFWLDLPKKGFSGLKQKKWTPLIFYLILHIQISLVRNVSSNWQFWFFESNLPKKVFPVKNWKSQHQHEILHIWISLGTKFQLKLIILSFLTKFTQKKVFLVENRTSSPRTISFCSYVVNVVVFKYFEDLKDLIILNIKRSLRSKCLKEKLVISCLLGSFFLISRKAFQIALCK